MEEVRGCHRWDRRVQATPFEGGHRCRDCRLKRRRISQTGQAAVHLDLLLMDFKNLAGQPILGRRGHPELRPQAPSRPPKHIPFVSGSFTFPHPLRRFLRLLSGFAAGRVEHSAWSGGGRGDRGRRTPAGRRRWCDAKQWRIPHGRNGSSSQAAGRQLSSNVRSGRAPGEGSAPFLEDGPETAFFLPGLRWTRRRRGACSTAGQAAALRG